MENDQRWLWTLVDTFIPCSCRCWRKWNILDILKKRLTSVGCFQLSCARVRLVLDVETWSAGSIDEEEKGPEPVGVCRVSDSNWANQRKPVWVDDCSTFTPASWHFPRRRPPDMTAQSRPDHFLLKFPSEYFFGAGADKPTSWQKYHADPTCGPITSALSCTRNGDEEKQKVVFLCVFLSLLPQTAY